MSRARYLLLVAPLAAIAALAVACGGDSGATTRAESVPAIQGDADCDSDVDSADALRDLRLVAALDSPNACLQRAGDVNCSGGIESTDALSILRHVAGFPAAALPSGCPQIGAPLSASATASGVPASASASVSPASMPTPPAGVTATATPGSSPAGTPVPGGYALAPFIQAPQLHELVDFALIPGGNEGVAVLQSGQMWKLALAGDPSPVLFGDISDRLTAGGEEGLLSLAFSPQFAADGRAYVYYTRGSPQPSVLSRFPVAGGVLDTSQETVILEVTQPYSNHNGGKVLFGHDGFLYLSLGDGGSEGDPDNNGQNTNVLLGKILRLDVTGRETYAIPPDNPFASDTPGRDETFAYGFRNPWRFSFDRQTGDLWAGDVGQDTWEEVDRVVIGGNYGWNCREGFETYDAGNCPAGGGLQDPRAVYDHDLGSAVTGGYVYRGSQMPELSGWYVYADFYSGRIWAANTADDGDAILLTQADHNIASFAELPDGELLVVTYSDGIYRLSRAP